ncbi:hypothetical protein CWE09_09905 [Aliidiomarina minuta]|uniref:Uncharacterized protein n=1 Tax=Aliidiomarina minuta TaxID=880057 RepID=A0A432WA41_9GAMM|nr:hypothetical protein [Aliidiomarina minuta]RUO26984.1 hypothetical protein CWE09_09905 [Aliidiomarina minuta]
MQTQSLLAEFSLVSRECRSSFYRISLNAEEQVIEAIKDQNKLEWQDAKWTLAEQQQLHIIFSHITKH